MFDDGGKCVDGAIVEVFVFVVGEVEMSSRLAPCVGFGQV